jgi:hypothetical protein
VKTETKNLIHTASDFSIFARPSSSQKENLGLWRPLSLNTKVSTAYNYKSGILTQKAPFC